MGKDELKKNTYGEAIKQMIYNGQVKEANKEAQLKPEIWTEILKIYHAAAS